MLFVINCFLGTGFFGLFNNNIVISNDLSPLSYNSAFNFSYFALVQPETSIAFIWNACDREAVNYRHSRDTNLLVLVYKLRSSGVISLFFRRLCENSVTVKLLLIVF